MALLKWELRKIWRPGILAAILVLGAVYYWMFPQFYIEHFTNGPQSQAQFALASGWVERYGPALEPEERAELDGQLTEEIAAFNTRIAAIPEAAAAGLTDYAGGLPERCEGGWRRGGHGCRGFALPRVRRHQLVHDRGVGAEYGSL